MDLGSRIRQRFLLGLLSPGEYELCETGQQLGPARSLQCVQWSLQQTTAMRFPWQPWEEKEVLGVVWSKGCSGEHGASQEVHND